MLGAAGDIEITERAIIVEGLDEPLVVDVEGNGQAPPDLVEIAIVTVRRGEAEPPVAVRPDELDAARQKGGAASPA